MLPATAPAAPTASAAGDSDTATARPPSSAAANTGPTTALKNIDVVGDALSGVAPTQGYTSFVSQGATKTDTSLLETPQTVDVVTRQQITDQGSKNVNDALRYTPGVFTGIAGASTRQDAIQLRGFSGGDVNNAFLDGLRLMSDPGAYSNFQIDPYMLERIDVVKGPSSVLYGRAQPGGLVNYVTKRPQAETERHIQFYGGSFDTFGGGIDLTGALPDPSWGSYRIVGHAETSDTQYDVVKSERYSIMPEVDLNLSDKTDLLLQAYIQHDPAAGFHGSVPYDLSVRGDRYGGTVAPSWVDTDDGHEKFDRQQRMFTYVLTHEANDHVKLQSKARYADMETDLAQVYQYGFTGNGADLTRYYTGAQEHLKAFTTDNHAQFDFATGAIEHTMLVGFDYQQRFNRVRNFGVPYDAGSDVPTGVRPLDPFNPDYNSSPLVRDPVATSSGNRKLKQFGVYLQDQLSWNRLHVLLSGREDYLKREYQDLTTNEGATDKRSDDAFSGRAAVLYESKWGISPYFSYSEAFNPTAYSSAGGQVASPTKSDQYEIGVKYKPNGVNALFTLALFDLTQKDVQQRTAVTPITFSSVGDIQSRGVEFTAKGDISDKLHVIAGYSYQDVDYQDDVSSGSVTARKGDTPARTPQQLASLWVTYDFPKRISAGIGGHYVGKSYADGRNQLEVPDYAVADAMVRADLGAWSPRLDGLSVRVNANNLLDKNYVAACFGEQSCYSGEERNITATVDYRF
ncbi:TonB-dependent siderophore receptor [Salinisphaera sp. Q1T1-3]|uniref:TonB-dependent siderophore receptor n=1 Tax=Salinisphaera sp. Q1T1-3 TaxID=2321229 RepID=UPI0013144E31|nr:TonB-dependent siderophore receptor [Salinisphaera sp. Q1T1-3]